MKLFNTPILKKEVFKPLKDKKVGMYVCGPTVYDVGHLGHGRSAVAFDVIRRYLIDQGWEVKFVFNVTDIDDKMIKRANEEKITVKKLAEKILPQYEKDYRALGVKPPDVQPRATEHIPQMIELIKKLEKKGYTYELDDGIYYDVSKFKDYGKLSHQKLEDLRAGARVEVDERKRHPEDFVLWKKKKPGEPSWNSPWGQGRPGWHIECSAMAKTYLGTTFDIHGGGRDLIFPHHEDEIAQSEAANGKPFAKYWLHNGFIQINKEKMSKSLGNFFTLKEIFGKYDPLVVRYLFISTHYRSPIDFSDDLLEKAKHSLERLRDFILNLKNYRSGAKNSPLAKKLLSQVKRNFEKAMDDDFETAEGLASIFEFVRKINNLTAQEKISQKDAGRILVQMKKFDQVLGFLKEKEIKLSLSQQKLSQEREKARAVKDFKKADQIRAQLKKQGIELKDTPEGTIWKKI